MSSKGDPQPGGTHVPSAASSTALPPLQGHNSQTLTVSREQTVSFDGPLPPPAVLDAYDRTLPGAANRIITMAEAELAHRHKLEAQVTQANIDAQQRQLDIASQQVSAIRASDLVGQVLGAAISLAAIGGAVYLAMIGQGWVASALVALPLAAIIRALRQQFLKRHPEKQEPH